MVKNCQVVCGSSAEVYRLTKHLTIDLSVEYCYVEHMENYDCRRGFNADSEQIACFESTHNNSWIIYCKLSEEQIETLKNEHEIVLCYNGEKWDWERA